MIRPEVALADLISRTAINSPIAWLGHQDTGRVVCGVAYRWRPAGVVMVTYDLHTAFV